MRCKSYLPRIAALLCCFFVAIAFPPAHKRELASESLAATSQIPTAPETTQNAPPAEPFVVNNYGAAGYESANAFCMSTMIKPIDPSILLILFVLLAMGVMVWGIAIEHGLRLAITGRRERRIAAPLLRALRAGDLALAAELCLRHEGSTLAPIVRAGLQTAQADARGVVAFAVDEERAELAWQRAHRLRRAELGRGLGALATIGSTAPLVGLLGTVLGILTAFTGIKYVEVAGVGAVAGGLAEAMLTTALGVGVAVPAVWVFNYFSSRVVEHLLALDSAAAEAITCLLRYR